MASSPKSKHRAGVARARPRRNKAGSLPPPAAVAFDLDGTLVDTVPARVKAWLMALREDGIMVTKPQVAKLIGSDGRRVAIESGRIVGRIVGPDEAESTDRRQGQLFEALNTAPRPLPGAREILVGLDKRGIPWAIATSSRPEQAVASLAALRLRRPATVVDGGDVANAKPAPDLLLKAARILGVEPSRCWYVGDSRWDMMAAVSAGMIGVGVTGGSAVGAPSLQEGGATLVCKSLREVLERLPGP